jgi:nucleotidyltransferase substrate binding protein (TIGR01987 family)
MNGTVALDFSSLAKALNALERAYLRSQATPDDEELRDACIQRFEFSFELAWKMLKRRLERDLPSADQLGTMSFRDLMRTAVESGLIEAAPSWWVYRDMRNLSAHTYDALVAAKVYHVISPFIESCQYLLRQLEQRSRGEA